MGNMFLWLTDIQGESLDYIHEKEIEIEDWTWSVDNKASFKLKAKDAAAQTEFGNIVITKVFDKASVTLMNYCATGRKINEAIITCRKNDNEQQHVAYLKIKLTDVKINNVKWQGKGTEHVIPETVELTFFKFQIIYETQGNDGALAGGTEFEFDIPNLK
jgi:type VI secretion system secreted protein Hcp